MYVRNGATQLWDKCPHLIMKLSRSNFETRAFVLNWASLKKLHSSIAERFPKVIITAKCVDKLDREFASLKELDDFNNPARAAIIELKIAGKDFERDQRFSIVLSNERRSNVWVLLDAEEEDAIVLNNLATDTIESLRPWYAWIARADWYWLVFVVWLGTQLALMVFKLALAGDKIITFTFLGSSTTTGKEVLQSFLITFIQLAFGLLLNSVRDRFFPIGFFAIGQGELRHSSAEVIRTVLIAGFVVSIVSSVLLSWFI
jgi:hypothetical protein